jgi:hypothetical protein
MWFVLVAGIHFVQAARCSLRIRTAHHHTHSAVHIHHQSSLGHNLVGIDSAVEELLMPFQTQLPAVEL